MKNTAMLIMDYINEFISTDSKIGNFRGYVKFVQERNTMSNVKDAISQARKYGIPIIYSRVGFKHDYSDCPQDSPLLRGARDLGVLKLGTWSTEFPEIIAPLEMDIVISKNRISPFYGTTLDSILKEMNIKTVLISGITTNFVVQSAAMEAHDRDYKVIVIEDCCAAGSLEDHNFAINNIKRFAEVKSLDSILPKE